MTVGVLTPISLTPKIFIDERVIRLKKLLLLYSCVFAVILIVSKASLVSSYSSGWLILNKVIIINNKITIVKKYLSIIFKKILKLFSKNLIILGKF
jgi:hypothetical protein